MNIDQLLAGLGDDESVHNVGLASTSPQCQPTTARKENNIDRFEILSTIVTPCPYGIGAELVSE